MTFIRDWITGLTVVGILAALADALTEKSAQRTAVRMCAGVCVLLTALWPLRTWDFAALSRSLQSSVNARSDAAAHGERMSAELQRAYVAQQAARTIEGRYTGTDGIDVEITLGDDLVPLGATVRGPEAARAEATRYVAQALGLPEERIAWTTEDDDGIT